MEVIKYTVRGASQWITLRQANQSTHMERLKYPTFSMVDQTAEKSSHDLLTSHRFKEYVSANPHLQTQHKHSFYHLLYFTEGAGEHVIDFVQFSVKRGMIYFMRPGQMHRWDFSGPVDGFIVNFSATYFEQVGLSSHITDPFPFFGPDLQHQVIQLKEQTQHSVEDLFKAIVGEQAVGERMSSVMIASLLIQLFITIYRDNYPAEPPAAVHYNVTILRNFQELVDTHSKQFRLPKDYANLLYITPNHLNALCKDLLHMPAGQVIRERVLLEAKRMLVNLEWPIGEIAQELNFTDSSYFVKFFKKYTGTTPEAFRNEHFRK